MNGQNRAGIGIIGDIIGNVAVCIAEASHLVNVVHIAVDLIREQLQACLGRLDQTVLEIVTENIVADAADDDAHPDQAGKRESQYFFLNAAEGTNAFGAGRI